MTTAAHDLARWCSLAVKIEPTLLRELRMRLEPQLDVGAESDLWWSDLVGTRGFDGLLLRPAVADDLRTELRALLAAGDDRPNLARKIISDAHSSAPPAIVLEETLAWEATSHADPAGRAEELMREPLRAFADGRTSVASWVAQALPRLPAVAREASATWYLEQASRPHLRTGANLGSAPPDDIDTEALSALLGQVALSKLGVMRVGDRLHLGDVGIDGAAIDVLASDPRVVEVVASTVGRGRRRRVKAGDLVTVDVGWENVEVRSSSGGTYEFGIAEERESLETMAIVHARRLGTVLPGYRIVSVEPDSPAQLVVTPSDPSYPLPDGGVVRADPQPVEAGRRWYGLAPDKSVVYGLVRFGAMDDIPGSPMALQLRRRSGTPDPIGSPVVVGGEICGIITSVVPGADWGGDGDLAYAEWPALWQLVHGTPEQQAVAPTPPPSISMDLAGLIDLIQALCLGIHTRFNSAGEFELHDDVLNPEQLERIRDDAEWVMHGSLDALVGSWDPEMVFAVLETRGEQWEKGGTWSTTLTGGDTSAAEAVLGNASGRYDVDDLRRQAVGRWPRLIQQVRQLADTFAFFSAREDPQAQRTHDFLRIMENAVQSIGDVAGEATGAANVLRVAADRVLPQWRRYRDGLVELRTPDMSPQHDLVGFIDTTLHHLARLLQNLAYRYPDTAPTLGYMLHGSTVRQIDAAAFGVDATLAPMPEGTDVFYLTAPFAAFETLFRAATATLVSTLESMRNDGPPPPNSQSSA